MPSLIDTELLTAALDALAVKRAQGAQRLGLQLARQQEQRERRPVAAAPGTPLQGGRLRRWLGRSLPEGGGHTAL